MLVEWINGPVDGSMFEMPEGSKKVTVSFLLPYTIRQALDDGWLPVTEEIDIPIERRNGRNYVTYPINDQIRAVGGTP